MTTSVRKHMAITHHNGIIFPFYLDTKLQHHLATYCEHLRRKDSNALGFVPQSTYQAAAARDRLIIKLENTQPCGYLFWGERLGQVNVYQIAVQQDARRWKHATDLICALITHPHNATAHSILLKCREDLQANQFWAAIGFRHNDLLNTTNARRKKINIWKLSLIGVTT